MIWAFLAGFFLALLLASWLTSHELDAAYQRIDAMERLCARAYQHMNEAPRFRSIEEQAVERLLAECGFTGEWRQE